jgi:phage gpG-like protein
VATRGATSLQLVGVDAFQKKLDQLGARMPRVLTEALEDVAYMALAHMQERYLTSGPLYARRGRLRGNWQVRRAGENGMAVQVSTNTKYAAVHNYGFSGPVRVREHIRKVRVHGPSRRGATGRGGRVRGWDTRLRARGEQRRKAQDTARREASSHSAHGVSVRAKQAQSVAARRGRGTQGGIEADTGKLREKAAAVRGGAVVVRAHGRWMKIRGHLYVERTLRDVQPRAEKLMQLRVQQAIERL